MDFQSATTGQLYSSLFTCSAGSLMLNDNDMLPLSSLRSYGPSSYDDLTHDTLYNV